MVLILDGISQVSQELIGINYITYLYMIPLISSLSIKRMVIGH
jgi:hypothetical protein